MEKSTLGIYPKSANFDDRIISKEDVLYDIFVFGNSFEHIELSLKRPIVALGEHKLEIKQGKLYLDGKPWQGGSIGEQIIVLPHDELAVHTISLPKENITLAKSDGATVAISSNAFAVLEAELNKLHEIEGYILRLSANGEPCYLNNTLVGDLQTIFHVGDRLVLGNICIERRPNQFKITAFGADVHFSNEALLEEPFKPEYPSDFPEYRRSPRILLIPPKDRVSVSPPEPKTEPQKGQILKTVLPPVAMVGAGALTSVLSGGNPMMMIGMASASVLTTGFTVSSYFTGKQDLKKKAVQREENYDSYLLDKQAELNKLENEQRNALKHHFPDLNTLAAMALNYDSRIYEKTPAHGDFLECSLGVGSIPASYSIEFNIDEQKGDKLTQFAKNEVVAPRRKLANAPITTKLMGETIGFAGSYPVLRTAVSNLLFQIAMFHS